MFSRVNPSVQFFCCVIVQHRHSLLADDCSGINTRVHEMHRAARHLYAVIQRLLPRFEAGK